MCIICEKEEINIGGKYCSRQCLNIQINKNKVEKCLYKSQNQKTSNLRLQNKINKFGNFKIFKVLCFKCNSLIEINEQEKLFPVKEKYFCSKKCSNSRMHTKSTKDKISKSVINFFENISEEDFNLKFSRRNEKTIFRSQGEINLLEKLQKHFPNLNFTTGGCIKYQNQFFQRDIFSKKLNLCIEYDGIWHFKNIKNQLQKKQEKDKLFEDWILQSEFRLIRVKDHDFLKNDLEFERLLNSIFNSNDKIIKLY